MPWMYCFQSLTVNSSGTLSVADVRAERHRTGAAHPHRARCGTSGGGGFHAACIGQAECAAQWKAFAQRMKEDHSSVNKAALELLTRLGVTLEETETSRGLATSGDEKLAVLRDLSAAEFDKAYVDNDVAYHEAVLAVLDDTLIPSAQNEELKAMLVNVRPAFVAHLEHARGIQASLNGSGSSGHDGHAH